MPARKKDAEAQDEKEVECYTHPPETPVSQHDKELFRQSYARERWSAAEASFLRRRGPGADDTEPPRNRRPFAGATWWARLHRSAESTRYGENVIVRGDDLRQMIALISMQIRHENMLWDALARIRADEAALDQCADAPHDEKVNLGVSFGVLRYIRTVRAAIGKSRGRERRLRPLTSAVIYGTQLNPDVVP